MRILPLIALALSARALLSQEQTLRVDLGTSRMSFADSISATAFSISPALSTTGPRGGFNAFGTFSRLAQSWSNAGTVSASANTERHGLFAGELEGVAGGSLHSDGARTGQVTGTARLYMSGASRGLWAGAGLGRTWDGAWRGVVQGEAGAWISDGDNAFSVSFTPTQVDDTIHYADALVSAQHASGQWELGALLGLRSGDRLPSLPANHNVWGSATAIFWATPSAGIVASAGTYPVDLTQGYPGGNYVSLSLRLQSRSGSRTSASPTPRREIEPGTLRIARISGDTRRVHVYAPGASTVELLGDFTSWDPVPLRADGNGWWSGTVNIPAGTHEVNVRIDGTKWLVPPGLTLVKDEFDGSAGLLVVRD